MEPQANGALTERERQIAELIHQKYSEKQIALMLGISDRTVEVHVANIKEKRGLRSLVDIALAVERDEL